MYVYGIGDNRRDEKQRNEKKKKLIQNKLKRKIHSIYSFIKHQNQKKQTEFDGTESKSMHQRSLQNSGVLSKALS